MQAEKSPGKEINAIYLIPLKYGGLAVILSIILFLVLYYFGQNPLLIPPVLDFRIILYPIILVFAMREFKEKRNGGILHFWQGMSLGIQMVLIIAFLMALFILVFGSLIEPGFISEYIREMMNQVRTMNAEAVDRIGRETIDRTLEILPSTTILDLAIDYFIKSLPYGLFLTIIISLILRKKPY